MMRMLGNQWTIAVFGGLVVVTLGFFITRFLEVTFNRTAWEYFGVANNLVDSNEPIRNDLVYRIQPGNRYPVEGGFFIATRWITPEASNGGQAAEPYLEIIFSHKDRTHSDGFVFFKPFVWKVDCDPNITLDVVAQRMADEPPKSEHILVSVNADVFPCLLALPTTDG